MASKKLYRSQNTMLAGVCGGLAEYFDIDVTIVRLVWVILSMFTVCFPGLVLYIIAMLIIPKKPEYPDV